MIPKKLEDLLKCQHCGAPFVEESKGVYRWSCECDPRTKLMRVCVG